MTVTKRLGYVLLATVLGLGSLELGERMSVLGFRGFVSSAQAEVGRPLSPVSVAGVARRNSR